MEIIIAILSALLIVALNQIDDRGSFIADDEIGWFFQEVKKIQEALNEFRLR
jgi:hypothetical protein